MIKLEVAGMEIETLEGTNKTLETCHPTLLVEAIKTEREALHDWLTTRDCKVVDAGISLLAIHRDERTLQALQRSPLSQSDLA